jgi:ABC-type sugar transport system ATPase subunit
VDIRLGEGEIGVILGPSGSGKSTLLRMIAGLLPPEGGSVFLDGRSLDGLPPEKRSLGMVFQDLALFSHMSVRRNIEYGLRMLRMPRAPREETAREFARSFSIERLLERRPNTLSSGEQQRVALARTLAPGPALVLLDEPLSSLDPSLRRRLRIEIAERLRAAAVMALHVTHDIDVSRSPTSYSSWTGEASWKAGRPRSFTSAPAPPSRRVSSAGGRCYTRNE